MFLIYLSIRTQEKVMDRYAFRPSIIDHRGSSVLKEKRGREKDDKRSTNFAVQAAFYVVVFFFTWFFPMLQTVFGVSRDELYYPLILLSSILSSMQGFSNAVVYLRPRWLRYRKKNPNLSRWQVLVHALGLEDLAIGSSGFSPSFQEKVNLRRFSSWRVGGAVTSGESTSINRMNHVVDVSESQVSPEENKCQEQEAQGNEKYPEAAATVNEAVEDLDDDDDGDEYMA
jgi:hypothetical protein